MELLHQLAVNLYIPPHQVLLLCEVISLPHFTIKEQVAANHPNLIIQQITQTVTNDRSVCAVHRITALLYTQRLNCCPHDDKTASLTFFLQVLNLAHNKFVIKANNESPV